MINVRETVREAQLVFISIFIGIVRGAQLYKL